MSLYVLYEKSSFSSELNYFNLLTTQESKAYSDHLLDHKPNINQTDLMTKLTSPRSDSIKVKLYRDLKPVDNWTDIEDQVWDSIFHPQFGYCHVFNLRKIVKYRHMEPNIFYRLDLQPMISTMVAFFHEENELADESSLRWVSSKPFSSINFHFIYGKLQYR